MPQLGQTWGPLALFLAFPVGWALGVPWLAWPAVSIVLLFALMTRRGVKVPPGTALWFWFLLCVAFSAIHLDSADRTAAFLYRSAQLASATILFLYLFNSSPRRLSFASVRNAMTALWAIVVMGGLLGLLMPGFTFTSLAAKVLPDSLLKVQFINDMAHPRFSEISYFLGFSESRPSAPFTYTNAWASNLALLTPAALASFVAIRRPLLKAAIGLGFVVSFIPLTYSLSRGAWISLGVGLFYTGTLLSFRKGFGVFVRFFLATLLLVGIFVASPLKSLVEERIQHPHSNRGRESLDREAIHRVKESPLLGFGAPLPSETGSGGPSVGTHGQLWLVLFSQGLLGLGFFIGWVLHTLIYTRRGLSGAVPWPHVVILMAVVQMPFYELLPMQWHIVMALAALTWRERLEAGVSS